MKSLSILNKMSILGSLSLCLLSLSLVGCLYAAAYLPEMVSGGAGVVAGLEHVDVNSSVAKGVKPSDLKMIKRIVVVLGSANTPQQQAGPWGTSDLSKTMSDSLVLNLINRGYETVERYNLEKVLSELKLQIRDITDPENAVKVGKKLNVQAIILGSVTKSQQMRTSSGFLAANINTTAKAVISNATLKVIDTKTGKLVMIITLSYKNGQSPAEAAKTIAIALDAKLKNPFGQKTSKK